MTSQPTASYTTRWDLTRVGAKGEEKVASQLDRLPSPWRVLHAVAVGEKGADIDHVLIGPPGVITLNT